ncbi:MAG TPA: hypothetical protein VJT09_16445, partial [Pyrinomonadaceae bacterium]|nr:hypothetical protein [Pyrinomonadaceae bacterium]
MNRNKETFSVNKTQNEEHCLPCGKCLVETRHKVLQSVDIDGTALDWQDYHYTDNFQIMQCQGCDSISFRKCHSDSEHMGWDEERGEGFYFDRVELYPSRVAGRHKLKQANFLPFEVSRIYDETHAALCNRQP